MSDKEAKAKKKGGGMAMKIALPVVLLGAGGGGTYGLVAAGVIGGGHDKVKEDNNPKLVRKGEEDPYATKKEGEGEGAAAPEVEGEGGSEYKTSYFTFTEDFTSNLKNSDALVQMSLACSTRRDGRVLIWLKKHELAVRSAMLNTIADTPAEDIGSVTGKERLQKRLVAAINQVLTREEGFGGIDEVYFKSFIVQ
ncbi:flagellar basal body-associated FliL family protein [Novosphingobium flavum]|uniref:Flagellar protein FliL n=1 Tax=Novosphingobium flavum TaxID=1778672 RepID=A0A7X1FSD5_9SPHN|nr:flagellar basal body-associated FliL family protein [Novosphingobium flavum]MBC2665949.1 flagellar basal body-associated FliL family protein [Novosphingobium flavum]